MQNLGIWRLVGLVKIFDILTPFYIKWVIKHHIALLGFGFASRREQSYVSFSNPTGKWRWPIYISSVLTRSLWLCTCRTTLPRSVNIVWPSMYTSLQSCYSDRDLDFWRRTRSILNIEYYSTYYRCHRNTKTKNNVYILVTNVSHARKILRTLTQSELPRPPGLE